MMIFQFQAVYIQNYISLVRLIRLLSYQRIIVIISETLKIFTIATFCYEPCFKVPIRALPCNLSMVCCTFKTLAKNYRKISEY